MGEMTRWEYRTDLVGLGEQARHLAAMGLDGWELVHLDTARCYEPQADGTLRAARARRLTFKRPLAAADQPK